MHQALKAIPAAFLTMAISTSLAQASEPSQPSSKKLTQPNVDALMHPEYAKTIARMAYLWGWPMVNMINRYDRITKAPHPGRQLPRSGSER